MMGFFWIRKISIDGRIFSAIGLRYVLRESGKNQFSLESQEQQIFVSNYGMFQENGTWLNPVMPKRWIVKLVSYHVTLDAIRAHPPSNAKLPSSLA